MPQPSVAQVEVKVQGEGRTLAYFFAQAVEKVGCVQCEPLQLVALQTKVCSLPSLLLSLPQNLNTFATNPAPFRVLLP